MSAGQLFTHFERIAEAPNAVPRLRSFILDRAVRGQLVEQDPRDEPTIELLGRIEAERARLFKEGEIRKARPSSPIASKDEPFEIPTSWAWVRLANIVSYVQRGKSPKYAAGDGLPVISQRCVQWWGLDLGAAKRITMNSIDSYEPSRFLRDGDLLWNSTGTGTIGRIVKVVSPPARLVCDSHVTVVRCLVVAPEYVRSWLRSELVYGVIEEQAAGSTNQVELTVEMATNQLVPLPPLAEQHRIVAKVNALMELCDRVEGAKVEREGRRNRLIGASLQRLNHPAKDSHAFREHLRFHLRNLATMTTNLDHIQQLRQTIIDLAVRGQLGPGDHGDELASDVLGHIRTNRRHASNGRPAPQVADSEDLSVSIPASWRWVRLGDLLSEDSRNGYSRKPDEAVDGVPILRISAGTARKDGIVAEEEHKRIGGVSEAHKEQYRLMPGDLLACRFNGNRRFVGRLTLYVGFLGIRPIYPDKLIRLRLRSDLAVPSLVRRFSESDLVRRSIESYCATTVGNWGISASNLKEVKFPLPPLSEQRRIDTKLGELMGLCDELEIQVTATQVESRRLMEAVLHQP
jgi:type I restriction enzyme, S subunit